MKEVKLTNSPLVTLVDDEDYERVIKYKWRLGKDSRTDYFNVRGYTEGKTVYLHRYILNAEPGSLVVDHIDRNTLNNQKSNLRLVTQRENVLNTERKEGYVSLRKIRDNWGVYDVENSIHIGIYNTKEEALLVRDKLLHDKLGESCGEFTYSLEYIKTAPMPRKRTLGIGSREKLKGKESPNTRHYPRPSKQEIHRLVWSKATIEVAKEIGCSDKAVEKWCRLYSIPKPSRGFWAKIKHGKLEGQYCPLPCN